jgi:hypothetical protein
MQYTKGWSGRKRDLMQEKIFRDGRDKFGHCRIVLYHRVFNQGIAGGVGV